MNVISWNC